MTQRRSQRDEVKRILDRAPWYRRLEARVIYAMLAMGFLCVCSSVILVGVTVLYFQAFVPQHVEDSRGLLEDVYALDAALRDAREELIAAKMDHLAEEYSARGGASEATWSRAATQRDPTLVSLYVGEDAPPRHPTLSAGGAGVSEATRVTRTVDAGGEERLMVAEFVVADPGLPTLDALAATQANVGMVRLADGSQVSQEDATHSLKRAVFLASGGALLISLFAGLILARQTTRKLTHISDTMRRVSEGDASSRAPVVGQDELAVLAGDLNAMLDQLASARARLQYLQRVAVSQEMARRLAHEIKNPLTPIGLAAQQLHTKCVPSDTASRELLDTSVEIILDEVETLRRMVTSFSLFSTVPEFRAERVDLVRVVEDFVRAYPLEDHKIEREIDAVEMIVRGDRQLLRQVLVNLVENAIVAMREAGVPDPSLGIRLTADAETAMMVVWDGGPGLVDVEEDQVFEPYVTTRRSGTGLGLSIVKKVVIDHGGEVGVIEHTSGPGVSFWIRLPLAADPKAGAISAVGAAPEGAAALADPPRPT